MSIGNSLKPGSALEPAVRPGTQAIETKDAGCMTIPSRRNAIDSLYLDHALRPSYPNHRRWDYIVSTKLALYGIETHSATTKEASVVIGKKKWGAARMREHLANGLGVTAWYWVASGRVDFKDTGRVRRRLNQEGITFAGKAVTLK